MDRTKAMKLMSEIKLYLTAGNPVWDLEVVAEACDMAIEALRNEINCVKCVHYTERETYTGIKGVCKMDTAHREDLISRQDAINALKKDVENLDKELMLYTLAPSQYTDNFKPCIESRIDGLNDALIDIESLHSAEPKTGKWVKVIDEETPNVTKWHYECDQCGAGRYENGQRYCSNCGSYNGGEEE